MKLPKICLRKQLPQLLLINYFSAVVTFKHFILIFVSSFNISFKSRIRPYPIRNRPVSNKTQFSSPSIRTVSCGNAAQLSRHCLGLLTPPVPSIQNSNAPLQTERAGRLRAPPLRANRARAPVSTWTSAENGNGSARFAPRWLNNPWCRRNVDLLLRNDDTARGIIGGRPRTVSLHGQRVLVWGKDFRFNLIVGDFGCKMRKGI